MSWESLAARYRGRKSIHDEGINFVTYGRGNSKYLYIYLSHDLCERTGFQAGDKVDVLLNRETYTCRVECVDNESDGWTLVQDYHKKNNSKKRRLNGRMPGVHFSIGVKPGMWETAVKQHNERISGPSRDLWVPQKIKAIAVGMVEFELNKAKGKFAR